MGGGVQRECLLGAERALWGSDSRDYSLKSHYGRQEISSNNEFLYYVLISFEECNCDLKFGKIKWK